jgi:hypothetical protein
VVAGVWCVSQTRRVTLAQVSEAERE